MNLILPKEKWNERNSYLYIKSNLYKLRKDFVWSSSFNLFEGFFKVLKFHHVNGVKQRNENKLIDRNTNNIRNII